MIDHTLLLTITDEATGVFRKITVNETDSESFETFIQYLYTGSLNEPKLDDKQALERLKKIATKYEASSFYFEKKLSFIPCSSFFNSILVRSSQNFDWFEDSATLRPRAHKHDVLVTENRTICIF